MFGGTLPTLDHQIWVNSTNNILYKYYEKPTTPITVLHARSAIPEATRRATLNQEMIRRMTNTSELVEEKTRLGIVDEYAQKLINSEYGINNTRGFIIGGLKGYERLLSLSKDIGNPRWKPLHLAASWNAKSRRNAKKLSKTNWYKGKSEVDLSAAAPPVDNVEKEANPNHQEDVLNRKYDAPNHQGVPQCGSDYDAPSNSQGEPAFRER